MNVTTRLPAPEIDRAILEEAAGWLVLLQSGEATGDDRADLERWRGRSPAHEAAWQRAEGMLGPVPAGAAEAGAPHAGPAG